MQSRTQQSAKPKIWEKIAKKYGLDYRAAVKIRDSLIASGGCLLVQRPSNAASSRQYSFVHCASDALFNSGLIFLRRLETVMFPLKHVLLAGEVLVLPLTLVLL